MEIKRGGKRMGAGRKPFGKQKDPVTAYVEKGVIIEFGDKDKTRDFFYEALKIRDKVKQLIAGGEINSESIYDGKENKSAAEVDEVGQFQESKSNYFDQPQEVKKRILVRNFEQYVVLKRDCSTPEEWAEIADEIRNSNLYEKQKALLLKPF